MAFSWVHFVLHGRPIFDLDQPSSAQECDHYFFSATSGQGLLATLLYIFLTRPLARYPFHLYTILTDRLVYTLLFATHGWTHGASEAPH